MGDERRENPCPECGYQARTAAELDAFFSENTTLHNGQECLLRQIVSKLDSISYDIEDRPVSQENRNMHTTLGWISFILIAILITLWIR